MSHTTAGLSTRLRTARLMYQRVNSFLEFLNDPHVKAIGAVAWIEQPGIGRASVPSVPGLPLRHTACGGALARPAPQGDPRRAG